MNHKLKKQSLKAQLEREFRNKTILITGGAGSIGSKLTKRILEYPVKAVRVFDINEHALFQLGRETSDNRIRLFFGSILDKERLEMAGINADIIIHLAALKNIEITEYNPIETIDVNINGTVNLIKMAIRNKPKKFLNISTDKAAEPTTLYGSTKQLSEKLTTWAGEYILGTKFATVRFGNVIESKGNVFEIWKNEREKNKPLSLTNKSMKRYFFHIDESIDFIFKCLIMMKGGEVFVPKMKLQKVADLAKQFSKKQKIIGLRPGEKIQEKIITEGELKLAIEKPDMWLIKNNH